MPDYDVFIEASVFVLDKTRPVRLEYPGNPVTAADEDAAITAASAQLADQLGVKRATGTYVACPVGSEVRKDVTFAPSPVLTDPPAA